MGDEEAARRFRIEQLKIDIQLTQAKAEVQRAEAEGSIAVANATMAELRAHAIDRLTAEVDGLVVIRGGSPHILSISLPGYRSEVLMNFLEARSIYTSKSSACKKGGRSHVLEAIGLPANVIDGALRISFSRYTTREDIDALCDALRDAKQSLFPSLH